MDAPVHNTSPIASCARSPLHSRNLKSQLFNNLRCWRWSILYSAFEPGVHGPGAPIPSISRLHHCKGRFRDRSRSMRDDTHRRALTQYKLRACAHASIQLHLRDPLMLLLTVRSPVFRAASTKSTRPRLVRTMVKARSALEEMGAKGEFVRKDSVWRDTIKEGSRFAPEGAPGWRRLAMRRGPVSCRGRETRDFILLSRRNYRSSYLRVVI